MLNLIEFKLWKLQRISALYAAALISIHLILQLIVFNPAVITFLDVSNRFKGGVLLFLDIMLLVAISVHSYLGFRSVLEDYANSSFVKKLITSTSIFALIATVVYGLFALLIFL